jgi:hypothetical protein
MAIREPRLSLQVLMKATGQRTAQDLVDLTGFRRQRIAAYVNGGVPLSASDALARAAGADPASVWPEWEALATDREQEQIP